MLGAGSPTADTERVFRVSLNKNYFIFIFWTTHKIQKYTLRGLLVWANPCLEAAELGTITSLDNMRKYATSSAT